MKKPSKQLRGLSPREKNSQSWMSWYSELITQYASIHGLEMESVREYVPMEIAIIWWKEGYSILGTLREAFDPKKDLLK